MAKALDKCIDRCYISYVENEERKEFMSYTNLIAELSTSVDQGTYTYKKSAINHEEMHYGPENKRDCPCDTCPLFNQCMADATECSAMRNWCSKGDYKDKDLQRLLRAA